MTQYSPAKMNVKSSRTSTAVGIPQTLLFLILKRLETNHAGEHPQQGHVQ